MAHGHAHEHAKRILLGLIGSPIAHSASPAMHEAAAELQFELAARDFMP